MRIAALALMLVGCAPAPPAPTTYGIGSPNHIEEVLRNACAAPGLIDPRSEVDPAASRTQTSTRRRRCRLIGLGDVVLGVVPIELRLNPGTGKPVCAIRIGPSPVRGYPDLRLLPKLAEDPALSRDLADLVATVVPNRAYRIATTVRGVRVRFELFQSILDGPHLELLLDGCDRFPPRDPETPVDVPSEPLEF